MTREVVLGLAKGRTLEAELELLVEVDIVPLNAPQASRKLVFATNQPGLKLLLLRGTDVATYVEHGIADLGMTGQDALLEHGGNGYYEPLDLRLGQCQMVLAGLADEGDLPARLKVATKYINSAKQYYAALGVQVDIIKLYGAMELAPVTGLAHRIVDLMETGNTLKANGLVLLDKIEAISTRLIVNKIAYKTKLARLSSLIDSLEAAVASNHPSKS